MFATVLASLLLCVVSFLIGVWVMISGWGLTPHSWGVIIGGSLLNAVIALVLTVMKIAADD